MVAECLRPEALPFWQVVVSVATSNEVALLPARPSRAQEAVALALAPEPGESSAPAEKAEVLSTAISSAAGVA